MQNGTLYGSNWKKTTIEVLILANLVANIIPKQLIDLYVSGIESRQY